MDFVWFVVFVVWASPASVESVAILARRPPCLPSPSTPPPPPPPPLAFSLPRRACTSSAATASMSPPPMMPTASSAATALMPSAGDVADAAARLAEHRATTAAQRLAECSASKAAGELECGIQWGCPPEGCDYATLCCQWPVCRPCANECEGSRCPQCKSWRMLPLTFVGVERGTKRAREAETREAEE